MQDKDDHLNKLADWFNPPRDAEKRLEELRALGPAPSLKETRPSLNLSDKRRWKLHERIETCVRRSRIRRLQEMRRARVEE